MPQKSLRENALASARKALQSATALLLVTRVIEEQSLSIVIDELDPVSLSFFHSAFRLRSTKRACYVTDRLCRRGRLLAAYEEDLHENGDGSHWLNDNEFKRKYRMSRETLDKISAIIEDNNVFKCGQRGRKQAPVKLQLMMLLHFLGKEGESNSSQREQFKRGYGTTKLY
ncbi:hypothetical protein ACHAW6_001175, partial [Cyclotella cf. meneghiniana]